MDKTSLLALIERIDKTDDRGFTEVISLMIDNNFLNERDLARFFGTSRPTIRRWKNGDSFPHPLLRKHIFQKLKEQLRK